MKFDAALNAIVAFERFSATLVERLAARAQLMPGLDDKAVNDLTDALGSVEKVEAMAKALPAKPALADLIAAFGTAKALGDFIAGALGGNEKALAALIDKGCKRDPAKVAALATAFEAEPETLEAVLGSGGLGAHPEALGAIFASGCGGDPARMLAFCKTFDDDTKREHLRTALDEGGLGQAPAALGPLVDGDNGALLLDVGEKADKATLSRLLQSGGMGGKAPDHPETLKSVLKDALGGRPEDLKILHDAFPKNADGDSDQLRAFLQAMNGKASTDAAKAGPRIKELMDGFARRDPTNVTNTTDKIQKMVAFQGAVNKSVIAARATRETGAGGIAKVTDASNDRAKPSKAAVAGAALTALPAGGASLLIDLATDPADKALLTGCQDRLSAAPLQIAALDGDSADRTADDMASEATRLAIAEVEVLVKATREKADGGTPADLDLLLRGIDALFLAAAKEPGKDLRAQGVTSAKAALAVAHAAMGRQAVRAFGDAGGADEQKAALGGMADLKGRIDTDVTATDAEKTTIATLTDAAATSLRAQLLANQVTDPATAAGKVATALAAELDVPETDPAVTDLLDGRKAAAEHAANRATQLNDVLKTAKPPIDPNLLLQASEVAEMAAVSGRATADATAMALALTAAKTLSATLAKCTGALTAAAEFSRLAASPAAQNALTASTEISGIMQSIARDVQDGIGGAATTRSQLEAALKDAQRSGMAAAEIQRLADAGDDALAARAKAAAERQAILDGTDVDDAQDAANTRAKDAADAAGVAIAALNGVAAPVDPVLIKAATDAADACARAVGEATDKTHRDAAITQGGLAAKAATDALTANARTMQALRATAATAQAKTEMTGTRGLESAFCAPPLGGNRAAVKDQLNKAFTQIDEAASAELAVLAAADSGVRDARLDAVKAAANAARPGASNLDALNALTRDEAVQAKIATLAATKASGLVASLTALPDPPWPPAGPPYVAPVMPVAPTADQINKATILVQSAISSATARVALATKYVDAAKEFDRVANLIPDTQRTPDEIQQATEIAKVWNAGADDKGAPKAKKDAVAALTGLVAVSDMLSSKASITMKTVQLSRMVFVNNSDFRMPPTTVGGAPDAALENAAGFADMTGTRAFKTVDMPDGSKSTTPPATADDLLATGANMSKKARPSIATTAVAITGHAECEMDLQHMCERHGRENFTYDPGELKDETDVLMSQFLRTRAGGLPRGPANEPTSAMMSANEKTLRDVGTGKTTTMWPEGIGAAEIKSGAAAALVKLKTAAGNPGNYVAYVWAQAKHQHSAILSGVSVGTLTMKVSLGVSATGDGSNPAHKVNVRMFYPIGQESLTVKACNTLKNALDI